MMLSFTDEEKKMLGLTGMSNADVKIFQNIRESHDYNA